MDKEATNGTVNKAADVPTDAADATAGAVAGEVDPNDTAPALPLPVSAETQRDVATIVNDGVAKILTKIDEVVSPALGNASDAATQAIDQTPVGRPWTHWDPFKPFRKRQEP